MPSTKTLIILGIGGALILGAVLLYSKRETAIERTNAMIGSMLGQTQTAQGKAGGAAAATGLANRTSPVPPHSPTINQIKGSQYAQFAKSRGAPSAGVSVQNVKGTTQPDPQLVRNIVGGRRQAPKTTSRPTLTRSQAKQLLNTPKDIRSTSSGRASRTASTLGSQRNVRRRFN